MAVGWSVFQCSAFLVLMVAFFGAAHGSGRPSITAIMSLEQVRTLDESESLLIPVYTEHNVRLLGSNLAGVEIAFVTASSLQEGDDCGSAKKSRSFLARSVGADNSSAEFTIELEELDPGETHYSICVRENHTSSGVVWRHQGSQPWQRVTVKPKEEKTTLLPIWLQIILLVVLLVLSGLFSGLNLGLMALDQTELEIIQKCGSNNEKKYAKAISPVRKRGNFLLCSLLIGNVLVNSTATILFDDLTNGVIAVIASTVGIVLFGEIIPQAVCSRHGLAVGARTLWLTRFFMLVTFPISFPISLVLDKVLGEEIGQVYNKEKLQELIRMTADKQVLQNEEANIISGALQLSKKRVDDIMTKIEDVYMLEIETVLDFDVMSDILNRGYTRVPVYDGDRSRVVSLLNTKDLALIDPDDNTLLKTVCRFYDHKPLFVDFDTNLNQMLQEFLTAGNSHMAVVQKLHNEDDCDPYYEVLGVVTLEDVIEEILQSEIIDETDVITDNRKKKVRHREKRDYSVFNQQEGEDNLPVMQPQLALAALQYLSTSVEPFKEDLISRSVLKKLIRQNIVVNLTPTDPPSDRNVIYTAGQECDYFVLILQGHGEVAVGKEKMMFDAGPFCYFGVEVLTKLNVGLTSTSPRDTDTTRSYEPYVPDFTLTATTAMQFLRIRRVHYMAARRATILFHSQQASHSEDETFNKEWDQAVHQGFSRNNSSIAVGDMFTAESHSSNNLLKQTQVTEAQLANDRTRSKSMLEAPSPGALPKTGSESSPLIGKSLLKEGREEGLQGGDNNEKQALLGKEKKEEEATVEVSPNHVEFEVINMGEDGDQEQVCLVDPRGQKASSKVEPTNL